MDEIWIVLVLIIILLSVALLIIVFGILRLLANRRSSRIQMNNLSEAYNKEFVLDLNSSNTYSNTVYINETLPTSDDNNKLSANVTIPPPNYEICQTKV
jgi:flagellar basal body-associated protein FliL